VGQIYLSADSKAVERAQMACVQGKGLRASETKRLEAFQHSFL